MPTIFTKETEDAVLMPVAATQTTVLVPLGYINSGDLPVDFDGPNFYEGTLAGRRSFLATYEYSDDSEGASSCIVTAEYRTRRMIEKLLLSGLNVLVVGVECESDIEEESDMQAQINTKVTDGLFDDIVNRNLYNVKFITTGAHANRWFTIVSDSEGTQIKVVNGCFSTMIALAKERTDCVALIEGPEDYGSSAEFKDSIVDEYSTAIADGKFAAVTVPWVATDIKASDDVISEGVIPGALLYMPGCFAYLLAFANNDNDCQATAGVSFGLIPGLTSVKYKMGEALMHQLNGDMKEDGSYYNQDCLMNCVYYTGNRGYRIWGANTAVTSNEKNNYYSFLNVRVIACNIKKQLYEIATGLLFSPNDDITWSNFLMQANNYLNTLVASRGISKYTWYKLPSEKKATIKAKLVITPIEPVDSFDLELNLSPDLASETVI